ncbi:TIGR02281 family clan AA aspartic protease [Ramlibacter sp. WS9]|uniref:retropepsin-like aspartic protease family protein n=1 Tax=Ramlibacter sp. WS9 TaxID=1882741 RepID=UPI00130546EC|nr:retropepsin-like aspartic protease [Ramlibacter sp. WS9]
MTSSAPSAAPVASRIGHIYVLLFWAVVMGVVWFAMERVMAPKRAVVTAQGELVIPRHRDGHFYVDGTINGKPLRFMVDTGASGVVVSEAFAKDAGLPRGEPTTFQTANGTLAGRTVRGIAVTAGPLSVSSTSVGVGLVGGKQGVGLLGQSFLSKFNMSMTREEMVLRPQ